MTDTITSWVCTQDLGPYRNLDPVDLDASGLTVRFSADTARRFARDCARLAVHTDNDTPVLREHDGVFTIIDGGSEIGRRHLRGDGTVAFGRPWQWRGCAPDANGRLARPYSVIVPVLAPYSVPDAAEALYAVVAAGSTTPFGDTWEPRLDYNDAEEVRLACGRGLDQRHRWCLRRPGHPGPCAPTPDIGPGTADPQPRP
jgi:hypothetical protein